MTDNITESDIDEWMFENGRPDVIVCNPNVVEQLDEISSGVDEYVYVVYADSEIAEIFTKYSEGTLENMIGTIEVAIVGESIEEAHPKQVNYDEIADSWVEPSRLNYKGVDVVVSEEVDDFEGWREEDIEEV